MKDKKFSVIIPVYNVRTYLKKCMDSILGQTFQNFEVIIVDDGSNDGSEELCDGMMWGGRKPREIQKQCI